MNTLEYHILIKRKVGFMGYTFFFLFLLKNIVGNYEGLARQAQQK